ncbi:hypothetical protein ACFVHW_07100 [Streptomyces sp. NPDC127110]|uniref:hypothetical protein n=1 Tax=Streptomyces sp. NPDC127110 TaxID=3345362 RepID=UPI003628A78C
MVKIENETATRDEIIALGVTTIAPGLCALAITLAQHLDGADAATTAAVVGRELRATLDKLRLVAPGKAEEDGLDDLAARRAARRGA